MVNKVLMALKHLQRMQKTAEATGDLSGNKIADKITNMVL